MEKRRIGEEEERQVRGENKGKEKSRGRMKKRRGEDDARKEE